MPTYVRILTDYYEVIGAHAQDATISSATTLTKPADATHLWLQCTGQNIRYRVDGTNPTTSLGFRLVADTMITFPVPGADVRIIEEAATGTAEYQWLRYA